MIALKHELNVQVAQLTDLKARQAFSSRSALPAPPPLRYPAPVPPIPVEALLPDGASGPSNGQAAPIAASDNNQSDGSQTGAGGTSSTAQNRPDPGVIEAIDQSLENPPIVLTPLPDSPAAVLPASGPPNSASTPAPPSGEGLPRRVEPIAQPPRWLTVLAARTLRLRVIQRSATFSRGRLTTFPETTLRVNT